MAARLGNVLFWLGIIIAVGYVLAVGYVATGLSEAGTLLVFAVPTITVAVGWAPRYILGGSFRVPTLEEAKARFKSSWR
jgi:cytosine/uracil/thiamine/allantoin permease